MVLPRFSYRASAHEESRRTKIHLLFTESILDMAYLFPDIEITGYIDSFNSLKDQKRLIPKWLSPLEPHQRHHGVRTNRVNGVGNWFLETDELRNWSGASGGNGYVPPVLFCYGDPGVGKTYLR